MRCSCIRCGTYMVHSEKGIDSGCICPNCLATCNSCLGPGKTVQPIQKKGGKLVIPDELKDRYDNS